MAFENMEAKILLWRLSDEKIDELREKHKFHNGCSITSDKINKKNVRWPGAQYAPVKKQTHKKTP
jgi:hypothetical protein